MITSAPDFLALRRRFPTLRERTYFATQCLGPLPAEAFADLEAYRRTLMLRSRGLGAWIERMEEMHGLVEQLLSAPPGSVALLPSATAAQAALASSIEPLGARHRIVLTQVDFHSSRYLWSAQTRRGFSVVDVPPEDCASGPTGTRKVLGAAQVLAAIDERVAVVAVSLVSPRSGALLDIAPIVRKAHAVGARVVVDAYQAVGVVPIDVVALGVDALVGGTHKWLCGGGTGLAFMYVHPDWVRDMNPVYPGWLGHRELLGFEPTFRPREGARKLQQGTPALEPIYTARAGLRFALDVGVANIRARNSLLVRRLIAGVQALGLPLWTPVRDEDRGGMLVIADRPGSLGGEDVAVALERRGIDVDHRPGAGLRIAPHPCNTEGECDELLAVLAELVG